MTGVTGIGLQMQADPVSSQQLRGNEPPGGGAPLQHEQDFANAVQRNSPVEQIDAQPATTGNSMTSNAVQRLDTIAAHWRADAPGGAETAHRQTLLSGDPASASLPQAPKAANGLESINDALDKAMTNYERSAAFAVEGEAVNSASQTVTKVWDNLMKGQ